MVKYTECLVHIDVCSVTNVYSPGIRVLNVDYFVEFPSFSTLRIRSILGSVFYLFALYCLFGLLLLFFILILFWFFLFFF